MTFSGIEFLEVIKLFLFETFSGICRCTGPGYISVQNHPQFMPLCKPNPLSITSYHKSLQWSLITGFRWQALLKETAKSKKQEQFKTMLLSHNFLDLSLSFCSFPKLCISEWWARCQRHIDIALTPPGGQVSRAPSLASPSAAPESHPESSICKLRTDQCLSGWF